MTEPLDLTAGGCTWFRVNLSELRSRFQLPGHFLLMDMDLVFSELSNGRMSGGLRIESPIYAEILYHVARLSHGSLAAPPKAIRDLLVQLGELGGISAIDLLADSVPLDGDLG